MLLRFVDFSQEQPEYFALMFVDRSVPRIRDHYQRFPLLIEAKRRMTEAFDAATACPVPQGTQGHVDPWHAIASTMSQMEPPDLGK